MSCKECGGDGTKYVSMCDKHKAEALETDARRMGVADLVVSLAVDDATVLKQIRNKLPLSLSGYLLVKVIP